MPRYGSLINISPSALQVVAVESFAYFNILCQASVLLLFCNDHYWMNLSRLKRMIDTGTADFGFFWKGFFIFALFLFVQTRHIARIFCLCWMQTLPMKNVLILKNTNTIFYAREQYANCYANYQNLIEKKRLNACKEWRKIVVGYAWFAYRGVTRVNWPNRVPPPPEIF